MFKIQWLASIWRQNDQNKAKLQKWSKSNDLHRFDVITIKTKLNYKSDLNYKSYQNSMSTKPIKLQWIASIGCQNDQNKPKLTKVIRIQWLASLNDKKCWVTSQNIQNSAKLQNRSNYNELHRLDVRTIKTKLNYKSDLNYKSVQNSMSCIDLTSKRSKMLSYVAKHSKQCKTTKPIKLQWIASIGCQNDQNKAKLTKVIKIQWLARQNDKKCWVTSQNIQNNAKLQNRSNYNELHRLDVRTIKTKLNYKSDLNYKSVQNSMSCIDLTSKRSKMLSYVAKHSKQRKTTKPIKLQWIASIGCQNDQNKPKLTKVIRILWLASLNDKKSWVTSQNIQNNAKLLNRSNYNELHRLDVKTIKTKLNYKSDLNNKSVQNPMTCIDLTSKRSTQS